MAVAYSITLVFLALTMLGTLVRVVRGPARGDRLLGVALASTTGIGFLLVAAVRFDVPALRDAALVIGALAVVLVASSIRAGQSGSSRPDATGSVSFELDACNTADRRPGPDAEERRSDG